MLSLCAQSVFDWKRQASLMHFLRGSTEQGSCFQVTVAKLLEFSREKGFCTKETLPGRYGIQPVFFILFYFILFWYRSTAAVLPSTMLGKCEINNKASQTSSQKRGGRNVRTLYHKLLLHTKPQHCCFNRAFH